MRKKMPAVFALLSLCVLAATSVPVAEAGDGKLRERLRERLQEKAQTGEDMFSEELGGSCEDHYAKIERRIRSMGARALARRPICAILPMARMSASAWTFTCPRAKRSGRAARLLF